MLQVLRQFAPAQAKQILKPRFAHPDQRIQCTQQNQLMPGLSDTKLTENFSCQKALFTIDDDINRNADQYFR